MSRRDNSGPAFPRPSSDDRTQGDQPDGNKTVREQDGMSLRDYFAAKAMQGLATVEHGDKYDFAGRAYQIADAMLVERSK